MPATLSARIAAAFLLVATVPPASSATPAATVSGDHPSRRAVRSLIREMMDPTAPKVGVLPSPGPRWLERHRETLVDIQPAPLAEQPWGLTALRPAGGGKPGLVYLYVFDWHSSGNLVLYGATGGVRKAYLWDDVRKAELPVARLNRSLVVTVPKQPPDTLASVVVLEVEGAVETTETVTRTAEGQIVLHARDAVIHGRTVRYEPEPHKNTVGYWSDVADWVSWQAGIAEPGVYRVEILQGCGKGSGGSKVEFAAGGQVLAVTVEDTGGFQNFVPRDIGTMRFDEPGVYTLTVKPTHKPGAAVMDLRQVTLKRVGE